NDHVHACALEFCRLLGHPLTFAVRVARLHHEGLSFHVSKLAHALTEGVHGWIASSRIATRHPADAGHFGRCLCSGDKWCQHGPQSDHEENSDVSWFHSGLPFSVYCRRRTLPLSGGPQVLTHALAKSLRCGPSAPVGG